MAQKHAIECWATFCKANSLMFAPVICSWSCAEGCQLCLLLLQQLFWPCTRDTACPPQIAPCAFSACIWFHMIRKEILSQDCKAAATATSCCCIASCDLMRNKHAELLMNSTAGMSRNATSKQKTARQSTYLACTTRLWGSRPSCRINHCSCGGSCFILYP